jgi:pseudolysin/vibriolysin
MPSNVRLKLLVAAIGMACASTAMAANSEHVNVQNLGAVPAGSLATRLNLGANMSLTARSTAHLPNGKQVVRQQQMYRGVPVYGRSVAVEQDAHGNVLHASGNVMKLPANLAAPLSVTPKLSGAQAIAKLQAHAHTTLAGGASIYNKKADLFVYPQENGSPRLVYLTSYVVGGQHPSRPTAIVDAHTGAVIQSWDGLTDATANGPGGNQELQTDITWHFRYSIKEKFGASEPDAVTSDPMRELAVSGTAPRAYCQRSLLHPDARCFSPFLP